MDPYLRRRYFTRLERSCGGNARRDILGRIVCITAPSVTWAVLCAAFLPSSPLQRVAPPSLHTGTTPRICSLLQKVRQLAAERGRFGSVPPAPRRSPPSFPACTRNS